MTNLFPVPFLTTMAQTPYFPVAKLLFVSSPKRYSLFFAIGSANPVLCGDPSVLPSSSPFLALPCTESFGVCGPLTEAGPSRAGQGIVFASLWPGFAHPHPISARTPPVSHQLSCSCISRVNPQGSSITLKGPFTLNHRLPASPPPLSMHTAFLSFAITFFPPPESPVRACSFPCL